MILNPKNGRHGFELIGSFGWDREGKLRQVAEPFTYLKLMLTNEEFSREVGVS